MKQCKADGCDNLFVPYSSTLQKYCSADCTYKMHMKGRQDKPNPVKPIKRLSGKRKKEEAEFHREKIKFLNLPENKQCRVFPDQRAIEVHHMKGRIGSLLLDKRFWLPVSRDGHMKVERNPNWAKENGYSLSRLSNG